MTAVICGIDVSSETLDARIGQDGPCLQVARSPVGIGELAAFCRGHAVTLAVMEATGSYEKLPFGLLWEAGIPCALANPRSVRQFAEGMGVFEKTDRIDAGMIAWYAEVKRLVAQPPDSAAQQRLSALVTRLRQLTELKVAQGNQRRLLTDAEVCAGFDELLAMIRGQIRRTEQAIAGLIDSDPLWKTLGETFRQLKGVADRTVARLLAEMPEIGTLSGKAVAKLAGLAPIARDSGKKTGARHIWGGREGVRSILFLVTEIVRRYDSDFADVHARLSNAGKPKKVVRTALARKLLVRLNAKARDARAQMQLPA